MLIAKLGSKWVLMLVLVSSLGCASISSDEFDALARIQAALGEARKDYVIQPGDTVSLTVFRAAGIAAEYKQEVTVAPDGKITLIGITDPVSTTGLSVAQLQVRATELYRPIMQRGAGVADPNLVVTVQFLTSNKSVWLPDQVFVAGQVKQPRAIPYRKGLTALKAVADAGNWIYAANESRTVVLRRNAEGRSVAREVDLYAVTLHQAEDVDLEPGDVVFVPLSIIARINLFVEFYIRGIIPINPSILRTFTVL